MIRACSAENSSSHMGSRFSSASRTSASVIASSCSRAARHVEMMTKALLATRPIFHKTDAGIRGHIFCTFLALVLRKELMERLAARRSKDIEWQRVLDDLADLSQIEVEKDNRHALLRTAPGPTIDAVCRATGVTLPPVFQEVPQHR
jgi:hypothetical protein